MGGGYLRCNQVGRGWRYCGEFNRGRLQSCLFGSLRTLIHSTVVDSIGLEGLGRQRRFRPKRRGVTFLWLLCKEGNWDDGLRS